MGGGLEGKPRLEQIPRIVFTLSPEEEELLQAEQGVLLRDRKAESAQVGDIVGLDGKEGIYEVVVESVQRPTHESEEHRDFAVSIRRYPRNIPRDIP